LYILAKATLQQLTEDENLRSFAGGLIPYALARPTLAQNANLVLAQALHQSHVPLVNALITALLVLDAEINAVVDDETRTWPLPGFLSYRSRLSLDKYPHNTLRLPPLNPGGHYIFSTLARDHFLAVRTDIHPGVNLAGHIRIAISGPERPPQRITAAEHRLDRQTLSQASINAAIQAANEKMAEPLTKTEQKGLIKILSGLIGE